jgi:hypothetical protein
MEELLIQAKYLSLGSELTQNEILEEGIDDEECRRE